MPDVMGWMVANAPKSRSPAGRRFVLPKSIYPKIAFMIEDGKGDKEIATTLKIAVHHVENLRRRLKQGKSLTETSRIQKPVKKVLTLPKPVVYYPYSISDFRLSNLPKGQPCFTPKLP